MKVKPLDSVDFEMLIACFLEAFENYYVKMPTDYDYYRERWQAAGVRYDLSYGMFEVDKLVGFIINAIDRRGRDTIAFNTGTGVIPEYRGRRIVKSIYYYAIPDLTKHGITKCQLEVITENTKAIKAYERIGFDIQRTLKCFAGELTKSKLKVEAKEVPFEAIDWSQMPNQDKYSWDFRNSVLKKGNAKYYMVYNNETAESFFSINPENGTINQVEVLSNSDNNWERLFSAISTLYKKVRIINVDDSLTSKINAIEVTGLKNTVNQFEMELQLSAI